MEASFIQLGDGFPVKRKAHSSGTYFLKLLHFSFITLQNAVKGIKSTIFCVPSASKGTQNTLKSTGFWTKLVPSIASCVPSALKGTRNTLKSTGFWIKDVPSIASCVPFILKGTIKIPLFTLSMGYPLINTSPGNGLMMIVKNNSFKLMKLFFHQPRMEGITPTVLPTNQDYGELSIGNYIN